MTDAQVGACERQTALPVFVRLAVCSPFRETKSDEGFLRAHASDATARQIGRTMKRKGEALQYRAGQGGG